MLPMRRVPKPEDVGKLVAFLIDNEQSGFITGTSNLIDSGSTTNGGFKLIPGNPISDFYNFNED